MAHKKQTKITLLTGDTAITDALIKERLDNDIGKILATKNLQELAKQVRNVLPFWDDNHTTIYKLLGHTSDCELLILIIRSQAVKLREQYDGDMPPIPNTDDLLVTKDYIISVERALKRKQKKKTDKFTADQKLLVVCATNPKWNLTRIAKEAGVSRTYAYKCPKFMSLYRKNKPPRKGKKYSFVDNID